jgi:hypothetical protein
MTQNHKVFICYHHANDQFYKDEFVRLFRNIMVDWSVRSGDIPTGTSTDAIRDQIRRNYLRESTVTVVLIGTQTWQRKHVDWEIGASLRRTAASSRSGLVGILLPTYPGYSTNKYDPYTIPPRLAKNLSPADPFSQIFLWTTDPSTMQTRIHAAFQRRDRQPDPDNSYPSFANNRSGVRWTD